MFGHPFASDLSGMTVDPVAKVAKNWWLFLILGLVTVVAGILAIVYPGRALLALGIFAGISLLMIGVMERVEAFAEREARAMSAISTRLENRNTAKRTTTRLTVAWTSECTIRAAT